MGRESYLDTQKRYGMMAANIDYLCCLRGKKKDDIADYIGMGRTTFYARLKTPQEFTLKQLDDMARFLNVTTEDITYGSLVVPDEVKARRRRGSMQGERDVDGAVPYQ